MSEGWASSSHRTRTSHAKILAGWPGTSRPPGFSIPGLRRVGRRLRPVVRRVDPVVERYQTSVWPHSETADALAGNVFSGLRS